MVYQKYIRVIQKSCEENYSTYLQLTNPKDFKLRPIVAGPACETHRLSNFLDIILKPYLKYVKSHVKDDIDILKYIPKNVSKGTILSSFDVKSLYSIFPIILGLQQ